jgi:hypothetical protein
LVRSPISFKGQYQIAVNPRVTGRVERTWTVKVLRQWYDDRNADVAFAVVNDGKQISCEAKNLYLGEAAFNPIVGDSIELLPSIPGTCAGPYVIRREESSPFAIAVLVAIEGGLGFLSALFAWGSLRTGINEGRSAERQWRRLRNENLRSSQRCYHSPAIFKATALDLDGGVKTCLNG